jgi:hypothetical protein
MIVLAFIILLAQAPAPPQMPTPQQLMRINQQFLPEFAENRRQLMATITKALTLQQHDAIAIDLGANAVADEPNVTKLTSEIDGVLTPPARTAIAAAFERYAIAQQALAKQIRAMMQLQQSGNVQAPLVGSTPRPVAFVPADAARLLARQPVGMERPLSSMTVVSLGSMVAPTAQLRETMRAQMLAALTPAHRTAVGELYGQAVMSESYPGQSVGAQIDALLAPAERQAILSARAQYVADTTKQLEAIKAAAQRQLQISGAQVRPSLCDMMKQQLDAAPVDAGTALLSALIMQPMASASVPPSTAAP